MMKTRQALLAALLFFTRFGLAQEAVSPELARLKTSYQAAVTKAVSPLTATYRKELERLMDSFTRAGKLDQALQVKKELASLDGASLAKAETEAGGKQEPSVVTEAPVTTIEETSWSAKNGFIERIEFHAKGAMTVFNRNKKTYGGWTYKQAQDGSLAITATGANPKPGVFRFTNQGATLEGIFEGYKENFKLDILKK